MKKIILSLGMLIAVATATYAQSNTATLSQNNSIRNTGDIKQVGQLNVGTVIQNGATTTGNKATIDQAGKQNTATINEVGLENNVTIMQKGANQPQHSADVVISNPASFKNVVVVDQSNKLAQAFIRVDGDENDVNFTQSGDQNSAVFISNFITNDKNIVKFTQTGVKGQVAGFVEGDGNKYTVTQGGNDNQVGIYNGNPAAQPALAVTLTKSRLGNSIIQAPGGNASVPARAGINVLGDRNTVEVEQGISTRDNQVGIEIGRNGAPNPAGPNADDNTIKVFQIGSARGNIATAVVTPGSDLNDGAITQSGTARNNSAGMYFEGDNDIARINQTGDFNTAITYQRAATVVGQNMATINQPGSFNTAFIQQDGVRASTATITQTTNNNLAEVYQSGNGGHSLTLEQKSLTGGSRFLIEQVGSDGKATITQSDISGAPTDVEIRQTGINNIVTGITNGGTPLRITQTGNNNNSSVLTL